MVSEECEHADVSFLPLIRKKKVREGDHTTLEEAVYCVELLKYFGDHSKGPIKEDFRRGTERLHQVIRRETYDFIGGSVVDAEESTPIQSIAPYAVQYDVFSCLRERRPYGGSGPLEYRSDRAETRNRHTYLFIVIELLEAVHLRRSDILVNLPHTALRFFCYAPLQFLDSHPPDDLLIFWLMIVLCVSAVRDETVYLLVLRSIEHHLATSIRKRIKAEIS